MTISLPFITGPTSGRWRAGDFLTASAVLLMCFYGCGRAARISNKKPTTVASRGFLSKSLSVTTGPGGIVSYDDRCYYQDLLDFVQHVRVIIGKKPERSSTEIKANLFLSRWLGNLKFVQFKV
jgi:hypothetical protein